MCSVWRNRSPPRVPATRRRAALSKVSSGRLARASRLRRDSPKPGRQRDPAKKLAGWNLPEAEETRELVTGLGRSGRPILIGPWLSEAGFELLYWIPFLAWAKAYGNLDPSQLVVISRGGAASWYRDITPNYEDVLSFYSPDEFRARNDARIVEQRGRLKHVEISSFDREIIAKVTEIGRAHV